MYVHKKLKFCLESGQNVKWKASLYTKCLEDIWRENRVFNSYIFFWVYLIVIFLSRQEYNYKIYQKNNI